MKGTGRSINSVLKRVPILGPTLSLIKRRALIWAQRFKDEKEVFTRIYRTNEWGDEETRSGPGSSLEQTQTIISQLPILFKHFNIKSVLDIPCGDFNWMRHVDLAGIEYLGGDVVEEVILSNKRHESANIRFRCLNLLRDDLPSRDLILIRDCLVHFPFQSTKAAIHNVIRSKSKYLLMTHFTSTSRNTDILFGEWRPLNFELAPFDFPQPIYLINEQNTEKNGTCKDKTLALWRVTDLTK